jgi:uncharacterized protein YbaR (Trm112 family)
MIKLTMEEAREKQHNPWYCKDCGKLIYIAYGISLADDGVRSLPYCPICRRLNVIEKKERETPEEFEARTGKPWSDYSAVYMRIGENDWKIKSYREAKKDAIYCKTDGVAYIILCANSDSGIPRRQYEGI